MQNKPELVFVYHHLGLGDHFVCNGLVRHILSVLSPLRLYLPTKQHNMTTVSSMYCDDRRVVCLPVRTDSDVPVLPELRLQPAIFQVGFSKCRDDWDVSFYDSVGISFDVRWSDFKINRNREAEETLQKSLGLNDGTPYIVVHDTGSIGEFPLRIPTNTKVVRIEKKTANLLDWCGVMENAQEVHCVDSSVVHLAQCLEIKHGVFHNIRTQSTLFKLKEGWETIDYAS